MLSRNTSEGVPAGPLFLKGTLSLENEGKYPRTQTQINKETQINGIVIPDINKLTGLKVPSPSPLRHVILFDI